MAWAQEPAGDVRGGEADEAEWAGEENGDCGECARGDKEGEAEAREGNADGSGFVVAHGGGVYPRGKTCGDCGAEGDAGGGSAQDGPGGVVAERAHDPAHGGKATLGEKMLDEHGEGAQEESDGDAHEGEADVVDAALALSQQVDGDEGEE